MQFRYKIKPDFCATAVKLAVELRGDCEHDIPGVGIITYLLLDH